MFLQISPGPGGDNVVGDKDEGGDKAEDEAFIADQAASGSVNRSSSFLFDSLYDSSLLAVLSPHQLLNQSKEEESVGQEIGDRIPLPSTQERRRSELLANQEAEQQEAIQWGESSFNLSEWGDSVLVGEHFLERQSLLKHSERTEKEQKANHHEAQEPNADHVLPVEQPNPSQTQPQTTTATTTVTQNQHDKDNGSKNQGHTQKINLYNHAQSENKPGRRHETIRKEAENGKQAEMKIRSRQEMNPLLSENVDFVPKNAPESTFSCTPGLQEIFDCWPSMSDQHPQNTTTGHTANHTLIDAANTAEVPDLPQPLIQVDRKRGKPNMWAPAAESDFGDKLSSRHDSENVTERPGSAGDLIPPTQETPPVTPRVKLTTSSVQSPLSAQPLNQSTPSSLLRRKPAITKCPKSCPGSSDHLSEAVTDTKQPDSTSDRSRKHQLGPKPQTLPVPRSCSKTEPQLHTNQNLDPPPSSPCPELLADVESPVIDEGFTLQLSQDVSLCSSNSGTFSIIDVASDRRLFDTFINEWKTKERFSLALACEKREHRQQLEEDIGGKHKRGN